MKECQKSSIFKVQNPWVMSILSILKEIKETASLIKSINDSSQSEIQNEIEAVFKGMGINNSSEIPNYGFLKALQTHQYSSTS